MSRISNEDFVRKEFDVIGLEMSALLNAAEFAN